MRADRLLAILLLLQVHRKVTANELAKRLEVSERTIYRDMDALSTAGIPVYSERGYGGGWRLPDTYQTNLTGLGKSEIAALFKTSGLLADLGLNKAAKAALIKVFAAMPNMCASAFTLMARAGFRSKKMCLFCPSFKKRFGKSTSYRSFTNYEMVRS